MYIYVLGVTLEGAEPPIWAYSSIVVKVVPTLLHLSLHLSRRRTGIFSRMTGLVME